MCGIAGFIGLSKKPKATYELMTNLFDYLEFRGTDAAGIWATETGKEGRVLYHKEPIKSSLFIKKDFWKKTKRYKIDMLIAHARSTSKGGGHASTNSNNHPFVSLDRRIGMVHNGTIEEANFLSTKYQCLTETDSEVILRIFEKGLANKTLLEDVPESIAHRLGGIKDVWSTITDGAMAVAIGEREDDSKRSLFLFRNEKRPLWLADLRESFGQVFFFSSPDIWYRAMDASSETVKTAVKEQKLIEIPSSEVWALHIDGENCQISKQGQFYRFKMNVKQTGKDWGEEYHVVQAPKTELKVVTELEPDEDIKNKQPTALIPLKKPDQHWKKDDDDDELDNFDYDYSDRDLRNSSGGTEHEAICDDIIKITEDILVVTANACMEGTISTHEYQQILDSLEATKADLQGTLHLIGE